MLVACFVFTLIIGRCLQVLCVIQVDHQVSCVLQVDHEVVCVLHVDHEVLCVLQVDHQVIVPHAPAQVPPGQPELPSLHWQL